MSMTLEQIESEVLKLSEASRTELLTHIIESLDQTTVQENDVSKAWIEIATKRDQQMDSDPSQSISAEEVLQKNHLKDRDNEENSI